MSDAVLHPPRIRTEFGEEDVNGRVSESPELESIRKAIEEMGLKPIWLQLIRQFGSVMYLKGVQAAARAPGSFLRPPHP